MTSHKRKRRESRGVDTFVIAPAPPIFSSSEGLPRLALSLCAQEAVACFSPGEIRPFLRGPEAPLPRNAASAIYRAQYTNRRRASARQSVAVLLRGRTRALVSRETYRVGATKVDSSLHGGNSVKLASFTSSSGTRVKGADSDRDC